MGPGSIGISGLILILVVALLLFGPSKLPELGRAFGKTLREFKKGTQEMLDDEESRVSKTDTANVDNKQQISAGNRTDQDKRLPE